MTSEHGNFPMYGTKVKQDTVIISLFKKHSVEFFILHNNINGNFPLFRRFALKISVLSIYICMEIQLLKN